VSYLSSNSSFDIHIFIVPTHCRFDLACKAPDVLYEEVVEVDERVMLSEFFDEGKSDGEIESLERTLQTIQGGGQYSSDWPKAGVGRRIAGVTGEKVSFVVDLRCADERVQ
jgi:hypothetical protein